MRIGEVAAQAGVSVQTVRLYERLGLIAQAVRRPSGYREYPATVVQRIQAIKQGQALGFTLKEIQRVVQLAAQHQASPEQLRSFAMRKIAWIDATVQRLQQIRQVLVALSSQPTTWNDPDECPIIVALATVGTAALEQYSEEKDDVCV
jgi:DNA-binding transcriptional MerR regulator